MPTLQKKEQVNKLEELFNKAQGVFFADYQGLGVNEINDLRQKLLEADTKFFIVKNTLIKKANDKIDLAGPTAALFAEGDPIAPLKVLADFSKKINKPTFKGGWFENAFIDATKVIELSNIPSQKVLHTRLVGALNSPIYSLVYVLKANQINLVRVLGEIANKNSKNS